jgi:sialate O-acetylesterase
MKARSSFPKYLLVVMLAMFAIKVEAKVLLPQILSSNMVLQREKPILIWGFSAAGEEVTVSFAGQTRSTKANATGNWEVILAPLQASATPRTMTIVGTNKILLDNILIGEVWVCSGQSNMEYAMRKLIKIPKPLNEKLDFPQNEVENAKNTNIRIFLVNRKTLIKPDSLHKSWSVAQDSALRAFSVVGYFYAKELQEKLGIPVGMIESAVSGSAIEPWIDRTALEKEKFFDGKKLSNDPGKFYGPMIEPLSKYKIRGFLWYQGETNCFLNEDISYAYKMKALINLWRTAWNDQNLPFYYVQIAPFIYSKEKGQAMLNENTEPKFWEAQAQVLRISLTGMVITTDLNDKMEDLHPTYKWEVGRRLSLLALAKTYGKNISYTGPIFDKVSFSGTKATVSFQHAEGLTFNKGITGFEVAGKDNQFYPADAKIVGSKVILGAKQVNQPTQVRFNWHEEISNTLTNSTRIPALPFRTNNPLTAQFKISE